MSRRHHGRPHHGRHRADAPRPEIGLRQPPNPSTDTRPADVPSGSIDATDRPLAGTIEAEPAPTNGVSYTNGAGLTNGALPTNGGTPTSGAAPTNGGVPTNGAAPINGNGAAQEDRPNGVTAPQLRRFIKSRPYIPMHELRRRFAIDGSDDEVTQVQLADSNVYVGLPEREGSLLGELLRGGEIGYELSFDPRAPVVVGVYPMRPVPRP